MHLDLLAAAVLVDVLGVAPEGEEDVARAAHLHELHLALHDALLLAHAFEPEETVLVAEVDVGLVAAARGPHLPHLLLVEHLVGHLVVGLEQVLRLVGEETAALAPHCQQRAVVEQVQAGHHVLGLSQLAHQDRLPRLCVGRGVLRAAQLRMFSSIVHSLM